ncbi:MAG: thioesterase family protein [Pseudomonadota bacterium]
MRDVTPSCPERVFGAEKLRLSRQYVLPEWIDYNGHMNVSYYTMAFDIAFDELLEDHLGIGLSFVNRSRLGPMSLQMQTCYLGELMKDEAFHVEVLMLDCDSKRLHFFGEMIAERDGSVAATYEGISMCVDLDTRRSAPYPDWAQERLSAMKAVQADLPRPPQVGQAIAIRRR